MKVGLFRPSSSTSPRPRTARQSIRGRISGPIPIPSPGDDDEFPMRIPGTGIATKSADEEFPIRQRGAGIASPTPFEGEEEQSSTDAAKPEHSEVQQPQSGEATDVSGSPVDVAQNGVPEPPANPPPAPLMESGPPTAAPAPVPRASPPRHRTNPSSTLRYSQISTASTAHTGHTKDGQPQRKKSTLRGALSKLFGRKKKSASQGSNEVSRDAGLATIHQHRSDPSALSRTNVNEPKRSASLPITEFDRALRSHSIGPHDMTAIETARNSLHADGSPTRRRAVTTTSRLLLHRRGELGEHLGLSPRPASTHGRGSHLTATDDDDPNQIGRAITSDLFGSEMGHRRRSRSMSGLQEVADNRASQRRRSDEIRYWRESYPGPMSPISSGNGDNDDTGAPSFAMPESPAVERTPTTPPQPFSFGNMTNMNEMAGMRITQAASMETRIGTLEGRVHRIERVVEQLCHAVPGFKAPLMEVQQSDQIPRSVPAFPDQPFAYSNAAPPAIPAIYQTIVADLKGNASSSRYSSSRHSAEDTDAHSSRMSFGEGQTYIGSLHPPSSSATQTQGQTLTTQLSPGDRPTSTATVRPAVSMPTIGGSRTPPDENDEINVVAELEAERAARQALEAQVKKLSERLNLLSTTMFAMVRDPQKSRSHERLKSAGATTPSTTTPPVPPLKSPPIGKPRSIFEDDSDIEEIKKKISQTGSATPSDAFLTPREEMASPQYGAFGEELRDENDSEDPKRKRAARTLSLSQLTRGKGAQI